ncbi:MAG: hypothetical protein LBP51_00350 [Deferribacteraceae bacterium]|jgi:hypothetical protein|nr:hypothetical protein [Deferribacteraceae bacterium]
MQPRQSTLSTYQLEPKNGTFTKKGDYPNYDAEYTFTATDGTVWYFFYATDAEINGALNYEDQPYAAGWYVYQSYSDPQEFSYLNAKAAEDLISQW